MDPTMTTRRLSHFIAEAASMLAMAGRAADIETQPMGGRAMRLSLRGSIETLKDILDEEEKGK